MPSILSHEPASPSPEDGSTASGLGAFGGVFTPSIPDHPRVIMYLRFGWIVGNVALLGTLIIVTLSTAITLLTALSVSAIATDRVGAVGGSLLHDQPLPGQLKRRGVGIPFNFAPGSPVALYTLGFAESVVSAFGQFNQLYVALITTIAVAILAITSAQIVIKAPIRHHGRHCPVPAVATSRAALKQHRDRTVGTPQGEPFWHVFAVFFPAVTGIMAGVNMSGDLRDPIRAIPIGTLGAVLQAMWCTWAALNTRQPRRRTTLVADPLIMQRIALWGPAILLGVWGSTLSSALGSILGAPRVLQALARDGVLPRWMSFLGKGSGTNDEPRIGTAVTLAVVIAAVCIGDLNLIAPVLTMFFLTTYLVLNMAAALESFLRSPSFRPLFRVHWLVSLVGAGGCFAVMMLINLTATLVAAAVVLIIYVWLQRRGLRTTWGDVRRGLWMMLVRTGLFQIGYQRDAKNWRPDILVLSGAPMHRWPLIELANAFTQNRGLITVSSILPRESRNLMQQEHLEHTISDYLAERGVQALVRLLTAADPFEGAERLVEVYGLGPLAPNTLLLGNSEQPQRLPGYCRLIRRLYQAQRNVLIFREDPERGFGRRRRIDVWWGGLHRNGGLMLLLAYLLQASIDWSQAQIYLKLVVPNAEAVPATRDNLDRLSGSLRINAMSQVLIAAGRPFETILRTSSQRADLVLLGMAAPGAEFVQYYQDLQRRTAGLPTTLFVLAGEGFNVTPILTE
ncbi:putative transporter protein [Halomicronema hongdechloris C2206]|uniref:Transporter protein n=1 Tax=Halomicronema hongdechloris C2206 TaxID=1641165 RepID=A0A1Z3HFZ7_9CYAN|nr:Na-K-Cl cotransporter [Halomicronema hongdechloris]ASC69175.1 putative transporter protein [Halomicronema hongdechloris C2206]